MKYLTNRNLIKEVNEHKIINLLVEHQELTKNDISRMLNISIPTVTTNISKFKEINLVEELESNIYTGGRKPKIIKFNQNAKLSIGVSIYSDKINFIVLNLLKEVKYTNQIELKDAFFDEIMLSVKDEVDSMLKSLHIKSDTVLGIGISVPGVINEKINKLEHTNMDISDISLDKYNDIMPYDIYYDNEANLSLLGEKAYAREVSENSYIYLSINEGLGGGIIINDTIYKGNLGRAGEFGHLIISNDDKSLETYVSSKNIINSFNNKSDNKINSMKEFEVYIENKNIIALEIMKDVIDILCRGLYNLILIFDPGMILIGGELSFILKKYDNEIKECIKSKNTLKYMPELKLKYSEISKPELLGAALVPLFKFLTLDLSDI